MSIAIDFVDPAALDEATVAHVDAIARRYLELEGDWFARRLRACDEVLLYRDTTSGRVVGTTTLDIVDLDHEGRRVRVLYTGAVVIDAEARGRGLLQRAGLASVWRHGLWTTRSVYWFCECDNFRAYRSSMGYARAWPRRDVETPPVERRLYEALCRRLFGETWSPETGTCAPIEGRVLKRAVAQATPEVLAADPDVAYFVERNPGYLRGEALPILVPLDALNWLALGRTMAGFGPRARRVAPGRPHLADGRLGDARLAEARLAGGASSGDRA